MTTSFEEAKASEYFVKLGYCKVCFISLATTVDIQILTWCIETFGDGSYWWSASTEDLAAATWAYGDGGIVFKRAEDAVLFKMTWL